MTLLFKFNRMLDVNMHGNSNIIAKNIASIWYIVTSLMLPLIKKMCVLIIGGANIILQS